MRGFPRKRICKLCGKEFIANSPRHVYCGNREDKTGCSHIIRLKHIKSDSRKKYNRDYQKTEKMKIWHRKWRKQQFLLNTDYAKRQRKMSSDWAKNNRSKMNEWQRKNRYKNGGKRLKTIKCEGCGCLFKQTSIKQRFCGSKTNKSGCSYNNKKNNNRKRSLMKKNIIGSHTEGEWIKKKQEHNYTCAICGIKEKELKNKYPKYKKWWRLTRDHIIPITKYGNDYISNIQPLCGRCNSSKSNKFKKFKICLTFMAADPLHFGHENLLRNAKKLCDKLIVCVSDNEYIEKHKKHIPSTSISERLKCVKNIKYVDEVDVQSLTFGKKEAIKKYKPQILVVGSDWQPDTYTGEGLGVPVIYLSRTEGISSTILRNKIK